MDPSKDADALSAVLDRLPDLDLGRVLLGLLKHDRLGLLEALELCRPARLALGLVALAGLLLLDELVLVRLEDLAGLLLGGRRRSEPGSLGLALGGGLADEDVDGVAQSRDEGTADRLERLGLRAVARLVVAGSFIDVQRIWSSSAPTSVEPHAAVRVSRRAENGPDEPPSETAAVACESASTTWSFALLSSSAILARSQWTVTRGERARRQSQAKILPSRGTAHRGDNAATAALARARQTDTLKRSDSEVFTDARRSSESGRRGTTLASGNGMKVLNDYGQTRTGRYAGMDT